jgi:actin-related protein
MPRATAVTSDSTTPVVVLDNGSGVIKAGFAGEEEPRVLLPSSGLHGLPEDTRPVHRGVIVDWDAMEAYWDHAFGQLRIDTEMCNLMLTAPLFDTKDNKERLMQCLFETFAAPGVYTSAPAVFELYASGRENGVVLGCGAECTYALLMHEGLPDARTLVRSDVAGDALTKHTQSVLQQLAGGGGEVPLSAAAKAKETLGFVAPDATGQLPKEAAARTFELPDGRKLSVTPQARAAMAEPLFDSSLVGHHTISIAGLCYEAIRQRDKDGGPA